MQFTRATVQHVATLCRLALTEAEEEQMLEQLSSILEHVNRLAGVDTSAVPPTASVLDLQNVEREDVVQPSLPVEAVLQNAPDRSGSSFRVRAILEEG
ncbi:MAG: Asp-tRNA(Asn)/Glu-tRNA(Gln) amidotransferase subunit GatC [Chloroflexi bacterium]|nr:Asp-tRNA(Asn)/Glu-tRNA(Gln) amidotransferase subunit GatC [Chloroflexota bacterium]